MRGVLCSFLFCVGVTLAAGLSGCGAPADIGAASAAGKKFHERFSQQDYVAIYNDADPKFREATKQEALLALLGRVHDKLGAVTDSTRLGLNVNYNLGGSTITMTYTTKFQSGEATERFVWLKSGGQLRLLGYNIQSAALNDSNVQ